MCEMKRLRSPYFAAGAIVALAAFCLILPVGSLSQELPQPIFEVRAILDRGASSESHSKPEEAARLYGEALQEARSRKDRAGEAAALTALGHISLAKEPAKSVTQYELALTLYKELGSI